VSSGLVVEASEGTSQQEADTLFNTAAQLPSTPNIFEKPSSTILTILKVNVQEPFTVQSQM
jgi:hypothetical protein